MDLQQGQSDLARNVSFVWEARPEEPSTPYIILAIQISQFCTCRNLMAATLSLVRKAKPGNTYYFVVIFII